MKVTGLLSFMPGATDTTNGPEVAPAGMVMLIDVALQVLIVTGRPVQQLPRCSLGGLRIPCRISPPDCRSTQSLPIRR